MEAETVKELARAGETLGVEFKEDPPGKGLDSATLLEAVVGLANADGGQGGTLLIGVDDHGAIKGLGDKSRNLRHHDAARLEGYLRNRTVPSLAVTAHFVAVDGALVGVVEVPGSDVPVGTADGTYKRRTLGPEGKPVNAPYPLSDMVSTRLVIMDQDYATVAVPRATMDDLDDGEFDGCRRRAAQPGADAALAGLNNVDILRALRLINLDGGARLLTVGALLLFGRKEAIRRYVPTAEIAFQSLRGTLLARNEITVRPLFAAADFLFGAIDEALTASAVAVPEITLGMQRVPLPTVTAATVRECVANALVHRDYTIRDKVTARVDGGGMRVTSPGGLPRGISLANLLDETRARSTALADAFRRVGYVERTGRGVPRMYAEQLRNGRPAPDYAGTTFDRVSVTFPADGADLELALFFHEWEAGGRVPLQARELQAIRAVRDLRDPTTDELSERLRLSGDATREITRRLSDLGCVEIRGRGPGRHYVLAPLVTTLTRGLVPHVPGSGPELDSLRDAVVERVRRDGSITRGEAADLCRIAPATATKLLKAMVESGQLEMEGTRRGARYVLPESSGPTSS